jgi:hypothetical protein
VAARRVEAKSVGETTVKHIAAAKPPRQIPGMALEIDGAWRGMVGRSKCKVQSAKFKVSVPALNF